MKLAALAIKVLIVGLAGYLLIRSHAGTLGLFGILLGALATLAGGWRTGIAVSLGCFVVAGVGVSLNSNSWAVVVFVGVVAALCASASRVGLHTAWLPVVTLAALASTAPVVTAPVWGHAALVGVGALAGVLVCLIPPALPEISSRVILTATGTLIYATAVGLACMAATWVVVAFHLPHGYWLIAALAACAQPSPALAEGKALQRQLGTVVGGLVGLSLTALVHDRDALLTLAIVLVLLGVGSLSRDYAFTIGFLAAAIVVLAALSSTAGDVAGIRIGLNLLGGAIVIMVAWMLTPLLARINQRLPLVARASTVAGGPGTAG